MGQDGAQGDPWPLGPESSQGTKGSSSISAWKRFPASLPGSVYLSRACVATPRGRGCCFYVVCCQFICSEQVTAWPGTNAMALLCQ